MRTETCWLPSAGGGRQFARLWLPDAPPRAVLLIAHGLSEYGGRYDAFARWLAERGYAVAAADHMGHGHSDGTPGCFSGGWMAAMEDLRRQVRRLAQRWPGLPLFLLGHSMGSFLTRTLLIRCPALPLTGVLLSGTAQYPRRGTAIMARVLAAEAALRGEQRQSGSVALTEQLFNAPFAPHRTGCDWISRDPAELDALAADPLCDQPPSLGLQRDMLRGIAYNESPRRLRRMNRALPVLFFSGDRDPVGLMGRGVMAAAASFQRAGMRQITVRLYPGARHETLHETNRTRVYADLLDWMERTAGQAGQTV